MDCGLISSCVAHARLSEKQKPRRPGNVVINYTRGEVMKMDLDEMEVSLELDYEDRKRLIVELRAAREVVIYATNVLRFTPHAVAACYSTKCECFHGPLAESIARYDEARRG